MGDFCFRLKSGESFYAILGFLKRARKPTQEMFRVYHLFQDTGAVQ
jgi:hypothetical protein